MERHEQARSEYEHSASGVESADTVGGVTTSATDTLDFAAKMAEVLEQQWSDLAAHDRRIHSGPAMDGAGDGRGAWLVGWTDHRDDSPPPLG